MVQLQLLGVLSMQQCTKAALWFNLAAICEGVFPCDKRVARQHVHFANWQHSTRHGPPAYPRPPRPQRARRGDDPCPVVEDSEMTQSTANAMPMQCQRNANAMPMQCQWNLSNPKYVYYIERERYSILYVVRMCLDVRNNEIRIQFHGQRVRFSQVEWRFMSPSRLVAGKLDDCRCHPENKFWGPSAQW